MKRLLAIVLLVLFLISTLTQVSATNWRTLHDVPRSATVMIRLLKAPGLNLPGSKWEIAYEFRMLPESSLFKERAKFKDGSTERAGDLIKKAGLTKSLASSAGHTLRLDVPFDAPTLDKLRNQPEDRLAPGQDAKSQIFVFYSVVKVHDARLKKILTIPVTRIWDFANFPDARFEVNIEITDDETINVRSSSINSPTINIQRRPR